MKLLVISQLNAFYQGNAERLAGWENHRTEGDHEDSLVLKRFFVEAFDSYIVLFYVGFFVRDPIRLCVELVSLYTADPVRRLLLETVILATAGLCGQGCLTDAPVQEDRREPRGRRRGNRGLRQGAVRTVRRLPGDGGGLRALPRASDSHGVLATMVRRPQVSRQVTRSGAFAIGRVLGDGSWG